MKFLRTILSVITVCAISSINPMERSSTNPSTRSRQPNAYATQSRQPKPIPTKTPIKTPVKPLIIEQIESKEPRLKDIPTQKYFAMYNIIMLIDPEKTETIETKNRLLVQDAIIALYEKVSPIIMTSNILEIITMLRQKIGETNLQKLQTCSYDQIVPFAEQLRSSYNLHENQFLLIILSLINFDNNNFTCYFHTSENLVLIIPKQYITANVMNASDLSLQDQAKVCGFNPTALIPINDLTTNTIIKQLNLQQSIPKNKDAFIHNLTSLFMEQKKSGQLISPMQDTPWAIYDAGHGGTAHQSIGTVRKELEINKNNLIFFNDVLSKNKNDGKTKENIDLAKANIKKYEKIIHNKADWPDSQLVVGAANIAGFTMDDFASLMKFFNEKLKVYYFHYTSCFDAGYKQTFVNETLSSLNVNFITSTQGLDERQTTGINLALKFNSQKPYISTPKKPFSAFFKLLRTFIDKPEDFVKAKKYKKEPFAYVLSAIVSDMDQHNQPFIRFPGVGVFGALSLGKKTKNLTNALIKTHEIENKPIDLSNMDISVVTITPSRINVPLNFGKNTHCAMVSPTPSVINPAHEAIHIFKEINFQSTLQSLIFNVVSFNARIHTQTFVIKNLTDILYEQSGLSKKPRVANVIHNLIIQIKSVPGQIMRAYGDIAFELNGSAYQCPMLIKNFEDPNLKNNIQSIKFTTTTDIDSLCNKFLTQQEVAKLKTPITLESLAQFIDSKVDQQKPSLFNQPGADNETLHKFLKRKPK